MAFCKLFIIVISILIVPIISEDKYETVHEVSTAGVCMDACKHYGQIYYWCHYTLTNNWDYCSPKAGIASNNCECTSKCGYNGKNYRWCWTAKNCVNKWHYCASVNGQLDATPEAPASTEGQTGGLGEGPKIIYVQDPPTIINSPSP